MGNFTDEGLAIATDSLGNAYITGRTNSSTFPTTVGALLCTADHRRPGRRRVSRQARPARLNPPLLHVFRRHQRLQPRPWHRRGLIGSRLPYRRDRGARLPTAGAFQAIHSGGSLDVFVTKIDPDTSKRATSPLLYSTFLGGSKVETGFGVAVDGSGNAYVTGNTTSTNFPTSAGAFQTVLRSPSGNAFVTKSDPAQTDAASLVYHGTTDALPASMTLISAIPSQGTCTGTSGD
jgi:hypothetical protein